MICQDYLDAVFAIAGNEESGTIPPDLIDERRREVCEKFNRTPEQVDKDVDAMRHHHIGGDAWG